MEGFQPIKQVMKETLGNDQTEHSQTSNNKDTNTLQTYWKTCLDNKDIVRTPILACLGNTRLDYLDDNQAIIASRYIVHFNHLTENKAATDIVVRKILGKSNEGSKLFEIKYIMGDFSKEEALFKQQELEREEKRKKEYIDKWTQELNEMTPKQRAKWNTESNIPSLFKLKFFANFNKQLQLKAFNYLNSYDLENDGFNKSILLYSPNIYGLGKTHLVCALLNKIVETNSVGYVTNRGLRIFSCPVLYTTETELFAKIRATFNQSSEESEEQIYKRYESINLLVIDDVGKVKPKDLNFVQGVYFRIIDKRYTEGLPIIITTNLDLPELESHIGGACADRLREMCGKEGIIKMSGVSHRKNNTENKTDNHISKKIQPQIEKPSSDGW